MAREFEDKPGFGTQELGKPTDERKLKEYGLKRTIKDLPDEIGEEIMDALHRAEAKLTPKTIAASWREILIVVLIIASVFLWWRWNENAKALATAQELAARVKIIEKIDAQLTDMKKREELMYPELKERISAVDSNLIGVRKQIRAIRIPDPKEYQAQSSKMSLEEISKDLSDMGYPNEVR